MDTRLNYYVNKDQNNMVLRQYLKDELNFSTRFIRSINSNKGVTVNGKHVTPRYILKTGDNIKIEVVKDENQNIQAEKMDLDIVYEDVDLIVVNKPPGIIVHPTKRYPLGTLSNGLLYYFREKGENCIVRLVNRLDMYTSGIIIVAKNQFSHMSLARDMPSGDFKRYYKSIVHGHIAQDKGTIDLPIYKDEEGEGIKRIVDKRGKKSVTHYNVIERYKNSSLISLNLETGRTHQIRVHLSHMGNPIYGDDLYGSMDSEYIDRQALHAHGVVFPHPRTGEIIKLETKLPNDMEMLINKLNRNG